MIDQNLETLVRVAAEDALFATLGSDDADALGAVLRRRVAFHEAVARGAAKRESDHDGWLRALVGAAAPVAATPWFVPLQPAIDDGLCLAAEPKGFRALLPIGLEAARERMRREGILAVRVMRTIGAADGESTPEELRAVDLLLEALALPEDDRRILRAEGVVPLVSLEVPNDLDGRAAKAIVAGAFAVALLDGVDDREREAAVAAAKRLGVVAEDTAEALEKAEALVARRPPIGLAAVDAVRYVLAPLGEKASPIVKLVAQLSLPPRDREACLKELTTHPSTPLTTEHALDRDAERSVLRAAWAAALAFDPTVSLRARLLERHVRVGAHLRAERAAITAREAVEEALAPNLSRGVAAAGA
ncbi:MAG: hypothetical protein JNL79_16540 [Myxococcales bacterium]|nr:hypothetical protein [Myxococcales bacterium]